MIPFSATTRISGLDHGGLSWRKGAVDAILKVSGVTDPPSVFSQAVDRIARAGGTPLAVARDGRLMGAIELKDIVKPGIRERFDGTAADRHPYRHDHRRQPRDRRGDRHRGRRG